ncbi:hypothetical protein H310_04172 [Aphanomyces invadans]|uniref:RNA helicase n=1 Tax=Aphanomyces invadans TaxID=157072 RepID=A0A024UG38_9STRA|nr:hypothetical protein H310_04172 [Aphanomyces invadans]ETW05170.1 hypothetical protein H310_04172 [Aphanomyces invadans]RHY31951.1 hypothetical protein DYB32_003020 [Aphanomyces invadans]|eukprot:XP_008866608.1 hypothetical protein H310_04172 [Aphanomyces invadans]
MLSKQVSSVLVQALRRSAVSGTKALAMRRVGASTSPAVSLACRAFSHLRLETVTTATLVPDEDDDVDNVIDVDDATTTTSGFVDQKPLSDFDLSPQTTQNLERAGITHLFPVQVESFSTMMEGKDIMGRSKTGSGKTLAFALPIVERLLSTPATQKRAPRAIAMLPTRELAQQVADEFRRIAPQLRVALVVGGVSYIGQENELRRGIDILVGTPGRVVDMMDKGNLDLSHIEVSVLDEADMMLKFGFQEEVETILGAMPDTKQCVMWSATTPRWVHTIARQYLKDPTMIDLVGEDNSKLPATVSHKAIMVTRDSKDHILESILNLYSQGGQALIFTETKQEADELVSFLSARAKGVRVLHGDLSQNLRTATMKGFRNGDVRTLICTDIAARGLDIANVDLVIQYRLSNDQENFVHRAGRTGRAGRSGVNVVLFESRDIRDVRDLESKFGMTFNHAAAPLPSQMLKHAMATVTDKLNNVAFDGRKAFEAIAKELLANEDERVHVVSSALALLAGFDAKGPTVYSMLTAQPHIQTLSLVGDRSWNADAISSFLQEVRVTVPYSRVVRGDNSTFYFDVPHKHVDTVLEHAETKNVVVAPVTELPKITVGGVQRSSTGRSQGSRSGYGSSNNYRSRDSNYSNGSRPWSNSSNGHRPTYGNSRFDSGFSRGGSSSPRSNSSNGQRSYGGRKSSYDNNQGWGGYSSGNSSPKGKWL